MGNFSGWPNWHSDFMVSNGKNYVTSKFSISGVFPSRSIFNWFFLSVAAFRANGHSIVVTYSGQWL